MRGEGFSILYRPLPRPKPVVPYPGLKRKFADLYQQVSCTTKASDDDWAVVSSSGRRIKVPASGFGEACSANVALVMAELRETMAGDFAFVLQEGTDRLWHRVRGEDGRVVYHPIASVEAEFGIAAAEHMQGINEFVARMVRQLPDARLVLGVKFANMGVARTYGDDPLITSTARVLPGDSRFGRIWALDMSRVAYDESRVARFRRESMRIVADKASSETLARTVAAPVAQPYAHGVSDLVGVGGKGKGTTIRAMSGLYGELAGAFSLAALLGVAKTSSTTNDQATKALITKLFAYDSDSPDPGRGAVENLKKAAAGEELLMRLLQQNVAMAEATAFMVLATNHNSTLPSSPEWKRRLWIVAFRSDTSEQDVIRWRRYLGDGSRDDDGIIDALMAGAVSFAAGRPDPQASVTITEGLTVWGRALRDLLMACGPLQKDGLPDRARVWIRHKELESMRVTTKEKQEQLDLMGLAVDSMRDIHKTGGDNRSRQVAYIKDTVKFAPFAAEWRACQAADEAERELDEHDTSRRIAEAEARFLHADPLPAPRPGVQGQVDLLRSVANLDGWLLTPGSSQWTGRNLKGINGDWRHDGRLRHDLRTYDSTVLLDKFGFCAADNIIIVDCDGPAPGQDRPDSGVATLAAIPGITPDILSSTLVMRSPHGVHFVWRMPDDWIGRIKASTRVHGSNIDLRPGGRSYVLGPGSHWTDATGEHSYPGVISLPPMDLIEWADEASQQERRLPMLPTPIADWISSDPKTFEATQDEGKRPLRTEQADAPASAAGGDGHVPIPHMTPGDTHDKLRDTAMRIAGRARNRGWDEQRRDREMDRLRAAVPAGHDPKDTEACITSAIRKAQSNV